MQTSNLNGIVSMYPEHVPTRLWSRKLKLVWTVEFCNPEWTSSGLEFDKNKKSFDDPEPAMKLFEKWKLKYPNATVQFLGFEK